MSRDTTYSSCNHFNHLFSSWSYGLQKNDCIEKQGVLGNQDNTQSAQLPHTEEHESTRRGSANDWQLEQWHVECIAVATILLAWVMNAMILTSAGGSENLKMQQ